MTSPHAFGRCAVRSSLLLVVATTLLVLGGTSTAAAQAARVPSPAVELVGDSLSNASRGNFAAGWRIEARDGRGLWESQSLIRQAAQAGPGCVVIALGSNDVSARRPAAAVRADIERASRATSALGCVVWTTVKVEGVAYYGANWHRWARQFNRLLALHAVGSVADWNAVAAQHPGWFLADGLHMNRAGRQGYANFLGSATNRVAEGVEESPGPA